MTGIMLLAGEGRRFVEAGYMLPKPLIPVSGKPMILRAMQMLPVCDKWIFVVRMSDVDQYHIDSLIKKEIKNTIIIPVSKTTEGQASSAMLAMPYVSSEEEIFIAACDNSFLYNHERFEQLRKDSAVDSVVWTFTKDPLLKETPHSWGWVKLQSDGVTIDDVSVKKPVSEDPFFDHAIVAAFYFKRAGDFKRAYEIMAGEDYRINNELYIDALPIFYKKLGKRTVIFDVDLYVGWGKPSDLYRYQAMEYKYRYAIRDESYNKKYDLYFHALHG